ncbi:phosphoserine phosphatase SerB [Magnetovibrio sp. PR-2]|uniref:phosphoserine phosphatase SerB n=1 Tax=Magnetovibrio sp. PR-2 TaxID=3120356 RepID=UPI002FCE175F
MDNVLTLITHPDDRTLSSADVDLARKALNELGTETSGPDWLADHEACDIAFENVSHAEAEATVRQALDNLPIDVIAQTTLRRKKKLIIADMDSTIVNGETLDDLAEFAGVKDKISAITARAMEGELDFFEALKARVAMLEGLSEQFLIETMDAVQLNPGAKELIRTMKAGGAFTALISGGFSFFTDRVRQDIGFDMSLGNRLNIQKGVLTGKVVPPVVTKDTKLEMLIDMAAQQELGMKDTLAIGDGANDVPMLRDAGMGIAYHGHKVARENANARLDHGVLTGALFIQGYRRDEFVA